MTERPTYPGSRYFEAEMSGAERAEVLSKTHLELLEDAFAAFADQIDNRGTTPRFSGLVQIHSRNLMRYWAAVREEFYQFHDASMPVNNPLLGVTVDVSETPHELVMLDIQIASNNEKASYMLFNPVTRIGGYEARIISATPPDTHTGNQKSFEVQLLDGIIQSFSRTITRPSALVGGVVNDTRSFDWKRPHVNQ